MAHRKRKPKPKRDAPRHPLPIRNDSEALPIDIPPRTQPPLPAPQAQHVSRSWPRSLKGWALFVEICTVLALLLSLYSIRPVLSANSIDTPEAVLSATVAVTNTGSTITHVDVRCIANKIVFANKFTLNFDHYSAIDEYSVPDVKSGESFSATCPVGWTMWMGARDGYFVWGDPRAGMRTLGIGFLRQANGRFTLMHPDGPPQVVIPTSLNGYTRFPISWIDGSVIVTYKWLFSWTSQESRIHIIGHASEVADNAGHEGNMKWHVAPTSEPVIDTSTTPGGFVIDAVGGIGDRPFGVLLKYGGRGLPSGR